MDNLDRSRYAFPGFRGYSNDDVAELVANGIAPILGGADLETRDIPDVEILSVGTWFGIGCPVGGCEYTTADLDQIADAYQATRAVLSPPVKLGHTDKQKLLQQDGLPSAGWLSNVRRMGDKLMADLVRVPKVIAELMGAGAYRKRSVELTPNFPVNGHIYPLVLTGMALLGADVPAVDNLSDIRALYNSLHLSIESNAQAIVFETAPAVKFGLPPGMSYAQLTEKLCELFKEQNPSGSPFVSELYADSAIFCVPGNAGYDGGDMPGMADTRYWQQSYEVATKTGEVTLTGSPSEVELVSQWQPSQSMKAIPTHSTGTDDGSWDSAAMERRMKSGEGASYYASEYAWINPDGDPKTKSAYKFPHHDVSSNGAVGAANLRSCSAGIAVLNGGRGGSTIPDADKQGVYDHLAKHLADGGREAPQLNARNIPYVDQVEHVLADVQALMERSRELVTLRAQDGRTLSEAHLERLTTLLAGIDETRTQVRELLTEQKPQEVEYGRRIWAQLELARAGSAALRGD